ncbi:MAG: hypothetical protein J6T10_18900 [Methanobrevibacter sp.]|nr:hypothetical protein [Methanobrevibacter sp.]
MTGQELVEKWINNKKSIISINEIENYGLEGEIALLILKYKYEGKYVKPYDNHSCGFYSFKNPLGHYENKYNLYYMYKTDPSHKIEILGSYTKESEAIEEIIRLEFDNIYYNHKEQIPEYINMIHKEMKHNMYYNKRYWFIWQEEEWVV